VGRESTGDNDDVSDLRDLPRPVVLCKRETCPIKSLNWEAKGLRKVLEMHVIWKAGECLHSQFWL
jgi:hypothetical protein